MLDHIDIANFDSGTLKQQYEYASFSPTKIFRPWKLDDTEMINLLSEANRLVGQLEAYSDLVPDIDYFIKMHITKEATTSSKIEGTQTSFEEALLTADSISPERRGDWKEVNNYVQAMNHGLDQLGQLPISERLIKKLHAILLDGARGKTKMPGQIRTSQNWIGPSLNQAIYVPPTHEEIPELMSDLEKFINAETIADKTLAPHLIRIAIIHYQFETIHPFLDGNGRLGRLLIPLYLIDKSVLTKPTLNLSKYFEGHRTAYYNKLTAVREKNDLMGWIQFFLEGVIETASGSISTFKGIIALRQRFEYEILPGLGKRQTIGRTLINAMYQQPIMDGARVSQIINRHASTANRLTKDLIDLGVIEELTGFARNRLYAFMPYIRLFQ